MLSPLQATRWPSVDNGYVVTQANYVPVRPAAVLWARRPGNRAWQGDRECWADEERQSSDRLEIPAPSRNELLRKVIYIRTLQ